MCASSDGRSVKHPLNLDEGPAWVFAVSRAAAEVMQNGLLARGRHCIQRAVATRTTLVRSAVERAGDRDWSRPWILAVAGGAAEVVDNAFGARRRAREDRSSAVLAAVHGRAVERAVIVDEAPVWFPVASRAEVEENHLSTGRRDRVDDSITAFPAARRPGEAVEHGFFSGFGDHIDRS